MKVNRVTMEIPSSHKNGVMIDYNSASKSYDNTRKVSEPLIALFHQNISLSTSTTILDFGCGTGNYLHAIHSLYGCNGYGLEPSEGMRGKAKEKNPALTIEPGDHTHIPYPENFFDFAYMTDVIHHIPDLEKMFRELKRVLKTKAKLCIVTQSHPQIESRFFNHYFPSLAGIEKRRYPTIKAIISGADAVHLGFISEQIRPYPDSSVVSTELIRTVEEKNWSMLRLLNEEEYHKGLERLRTDLGVVHKTEGAGDSLLWFEKN